MTQMHVYQVGPCDVTALDLAGQERQVYLCAENFTEVTDSPSLHHSLIFPNFFLYLTNFERVGLHFPLRGPLHRASGRAVRVVHSVRHSARQLPRAAARGGGVGGRGYGLLQVRLHPGGEGAQGRGEEGAEEEQKGGVIRRGWTAAKKHCILPLKIIKK